MLTHIKNVPVFLGSLASAIHNPCPGFYLENALTGGVRLTADAPQQLPEAAPGGAPPLRPLSEDASVGTTSTRDAREEAAASASLGLEVPLEPSGPGRVSRQGSLMGFEDGAGGLDSKRVSSDGGMSMASARAEKWGQYSAGPSADGSMVGAEAKVFPPTDDQLTDTPASSSQVWLRERSAFKT